MLDDHGLVPWSGQVGDALSYSLNFYSTKAP